MAHHAPAVSPPFNPRKSFASSSRYGVNRVGMSSSRAEKKRVDEAKRYAWARRDQEEALKALKSKSTRSKSGDVKPARVTKYVGANPHHDKYFDWEKEDQRLNIVNEVIDRHLRDADEECQVNWIRGMFSGGHEEECVRDVDAIMSIVAKHADLAEAVAVVRELVDRGGSSAANAVRTWCAAHADLPNATRALGYARRHVQGQEHRHPLKLSTRAEKTTTERIEKTRSRRVVACNSKYHVIRRAALSEIKRINRRRSTRPAEGATCWAAPARRSPRR